MYACSNQIFVYLSNVLRTIHFLKKVTNTAFQVILSTIYLQKNAGAGQKFDFFLQNS